MMSSLFYICSWYITFVVYNSRMTGFVTRNIIKKNWRLSYWFHGIILLITIIMVATTELQAIEYYAMPSILSRKLHTNIIVRNIL